MDKLISQIKKHNLGLLDAEIEGVLYLMSKNPKINNNELTTLTGIPKETLRRLRTATPQKLSKVSYKRYKWSLLKYKNEKLETKIKEIRQKYKLSPQRDFDQFFATPETTVSKAMILQDKGLIKSKNIALIGDDDLVSIAISLLEDTYYSITVFEIDTKILSTLEEISKDLKIKNLKIIKYDCRQNLPINEIGKYDVVITDPPYTKSGVTLFLQRAVELTNLLSDNYIFIHYGTSFKSPEKTLKIQEVIGRFNLVIEDKINKFARYEGAESIGSSSSLYILKTNKSTSAVPSYNLSNKVYTYELGSQKEDKFPFVDHITAKVLDTPSNILSSKKKLQEIAGKFCKKHKLKVMDTNITSFKKQGYTLTYILGNSNLLVHTWPEHKAIHIDLVTCSPIYGKDDIGSTLAELFETKKVEVSFID